MTFREAVAMVNGFAARAPSVDSFSDLPYKLPRMRYFLSLLGNPHQKFKTIHVGGTSGKGSTAAMSASILHAAGYKVGLHTQPYLEKFTEKIQINGRPIGDSSFVQLVRSVLPIVEKMRASEHGLGAGFYFQLSTALAFQAFADAGVDYGVIEVGMGGEFDSTNVIQRPEVSILTNVSLDHTRFLGDTVEKIAKTKTGIIKPYTPVVSAAIQPSVKAIIRQVAAMHHAPLFFYGKDFSEPQFPVRMLGQHQRVNAGCAVAAVRLLKDRIDEAAIKKGLARAFLPGRFEIVRRRPTIILDGAHNPEKMESVAQTLQEVFPSKKVVAVVGFIEGHDPRKTLAPLKPIVRRYIVTEPRAIGKTSIDAEILGRFLPDAIVEKDNHRALQRGLSMVENDDVLLITGSFYLVGPARTILRAKLA